MRNLTELYQVCYHLDSFPSRVRATFDLFLSQVCFIAKLYQRISARKIIRFQVLSAEKDMNEE